ncbi:MAG: dienelactone hydrolase family protein [Rhodospirillales bacterium]|nr:dienelactone hydrolase family protein [Rhodospirillales bacterium]
MKHALPAAILALVFALARASALAGERTVMVGVHRTMQARLIIPDGRDPYPGVLLLSTSGGLQAADLDFARRLARHGYVVLVPSYLESYNDTYKLANLASNYPLFILGLLRRIRPEDGGKVISDIFLNLLGKLVLEFFAHLLGTFYQIHRGFKVPN